MSKYNKYKMMLKSRSSNGHSYVQWSVAILANTTLLTYGLQSGWISPMSKVLRGDASPPRASPLDAPLSEGELSWIASVMSLSAVVGVSVYAYIGDAYGRRAGIIAIAVPQAFCWLIKLFTTSRTGLIIARICCGIPAGGCFNLIPMYIKEISQDSIRGALGSIMMLMQNIGILAMYVMGSYMNYYTVLWIVLPVPILTVLFMIKAPESPAFLVKIGKTEEASATIAVLRGLDVCDKVVQNEVSYMTNEDQYYKDLPKISFVTILKRKPWRRAFLLSTAIISTASMNGNFVILTHAATILTSSGVTFSPELQALSFPAVMIVGSFASLCAVERLGRKLILVSTYLLTAVALVCLASTQLLLSRGLAGPLSAWLPPLAIVLSLWAYSAGVCPIPYIVMSEMFHFQIRSSAMSAIVTYAWLMSSVQLLVFGWFPSHGQYVAFFTFGGVNVCGALISLCLPETRGRTVHQIEGVLAGTGTGTGTGGGRGGN